VRAVKEPPGACRRRSWGEAALGVRRIAKTYTGDTVVEFRGAEIVILHRA
jgi:hypothetical protein